VAGLGEACESTLGRIEEMIGAEDDRLRALHELDEEARLVALVTLEHDLRDELDRPGARGVAEVRTALTLQLEALKPALKREGARVLAVDSGGAMWASHVGRRGCVLHVDPWTASRVLARRLPADDVRALPHTGDIEPVLRALGLS
jgi:hypothetical protein